MQIVKRSCLAAVVLATLVAPAAAADPIGEWLVADGTAQIRIEPCADALWGVISWANSPGLDENNPNPALRGRSIIGLPILLGMKRTEANRWDGHVYNAENGKTYTSRIMLVRNDVLRIEGCVFAGLFCGGENWTRVSPAQNRSTLPPRPKNLPGERDAEKCAAVFR
jgi:uncharacterized protein (DUF2147 family)